MNRSRSILAYICLALGLAHGNAIAAATDPAATTIGILAGEEKEICSGLNATVAPSPQHGSLRTAGDPKGGTPVQVFYKASDSTTAVDESLTCQSGTDKKSLNIEITPKGRSAVTGFSDVVYPEAFKAIFLLFVVATVLESALAVLFNWRPFVETFNARAVRPLVSFVVALIVVFTFGIDIVSTLVKLITPEGQSLEGAGKVLTAMVIAGGSAGVNNLMVSLGFRQVRTPETATPRPPAEKGWISVSVLRTPLIKGPVTVSIGVASNNKVPVVASLEKSTKPGLRYFFRDRGRFPGYGGYAVKMDEQVTVTVSADRTDRAERLKKTWGPETFADGAIIDLLFTMNQD